MVISEFVQSVRPLLQKFAIDAPDIRIHGMTLDSREVSVHTAFVAVKGHQLDGRDFIPQAISLGTPIIFAQTDDAAEHGRVSMRGKTVIVEIHNLPDILSSLAGAFYDYPANKVITTAVTGTNGKTSTVNLITQLKHLLGNRAAAIGTLGSGIYEGTEYSDWKPSPTANTTPDAISMQFLLAEFVQQGVGHVAFEASSHALVQKRLSQVKSDVAVFSNLSRDHLDYHGTMESYAAAKRRLLDQPSVKKVVVNADDPWSKEWVNGAQARGIQVTMTGIQCHPNISEYKQKSLKYCIAKQVSYHKSGCTITLNTSWGDTVIECALLGEFNVYNLMSAVGTLLSQGERFEDVIAQIIKLKPVAGRMEVFEFNAHANVIVDYAHTPDALENVLVAVSKHSKSKPWCIFGCGGDRDKGKRPQMAQVAEQNSGRIVVTTDNARNEDPKAIVDEIMQGFSDRKQVIEEPDRERAIRFCLEHANEQDLIVVAGKGHEDYQIIGNTHLDYNERDCVSRLQREFST